MSMILGIDPGSRITGWGVIEQIGNRVVHVDNGLVRLPDAPIAERLAVIYTEISTIISRFKPTAMAIEQVFVAKNTRSALVLGHARGVAILAGSIHHLTVAEYAPRAIKLAIVGTGTASKDQIQQMIKMLLRLPEPPAADAADALAVAICHAHTSKVEKMLRVAGRPPRMNP